ncbi:hypothetical protein ABZX51_011544 [Aspergillus tubingensis]
MPCQAEPKLAAAATAAAAAERKMGWDGMDGWVDEWMAVEGLEELSRVLLPASIRGPRPLEPPARSRLIGHRRPGRRARFPAEGVEGGSLSPPSRGPRPPIELVL